MKYGLSSVLVLCLLLNGEAFATNKSSDLNVKPVVNAEKLLQQGQAYFLKEDGLGAVRVLTEAILSNPKLAQAYFVRALAYYSLLSDFAKAVPDFQMTVQLGTSDEDCYYLLSQALFFTDRPADAIQPINTAIAMTRDRMMLSSAGKKRMEPAKSSAPRNFRKSTSGKAEDEKADYQDKLSLMLGSRAEYNADLQKPNDAIADFTEAIGLAPDKSPNWIIERAEAYLDAEKRDMALADFDHVRRANMPSDTEVLQRGNLAFRLGLMKDALADLKRTKTTDPSNAFDRGYLANKLSLFKEAIDAYESSIAADPSFACAYNNASECYLEIGEWKKAMDYCNKSIDLAPKHAEHLACLAHLEHKMGMNSEASKHAKEAIAVANESIKIPGNHSRDVYSKIVGYLCLGMNEDALKEINQLPVSKLEDPDNLAMLAEIYTATKQTAKALECYDKLLKNSKSNAARYARGKLLIEQGNTADGEAEMKAATDAHYIEPPLHTMPDR